MKREFHIKSEFHDLSGIKGISGRWRVEILKEKEGITVILSSLGNGEALSGESLTVVATIAYNLYLKELPLNTIRWFLTSKNGIDEHKEIIFEIKEGSLCNPRFA